MLEHAGLPHIGVRVPARREHEVAGPQGSGVPEDPQNVLLGHRHPISSRMARAAAAGSVDSVIGRPTTSRSAPASPPPPPPPPAPPPPRRPAAGPPRTPRAAAAPPSPSDRPTTPFPATTS